MRWASPKPGGAGVPSSRCRYSCAIAGACRLATSVAPGAFVARIAVAMPWSGLAVCAVGGRRADQVRGGQRRSGPAGADATARRLGRSATSAGWRSTSPQNRNRQATTGPTPGGSHTGRAPWSSPTRTDPSSGAAPRTSPLSAPEEPGTRELYPAQQASSSPRTLRHRRIEPRCSRRRRRSPHQRPTPTRNRDNRHATRHEIGTPTRSGGSYRRQWRISSP